MSGERRATEREAMRHIDARTNSASIRATSIYSRIWYILLFMMMCFPRVLAPVKLAVLCALVVALLSRDSLNKITFTKTQKRFVLCYLCYGLGTCAVGIMYGNNINYLTDNFRIELVYTALFAVLSAYSFSKSEMSGFIQTVIAATIIISVYSILALLVSIGKWPSSFFIPIDGAVGIHEGYTHLTNTNLSSLIFSMPFLTYLVLSGFDNNGRKVLLYGAFVLGLTASLLSGRRIIWISMAIPFVTYPFMRDRKASGMPKKRNWPLFLLGCALVVIVAVGVLRSGLFKWEGIEERFLDAFSGKSDGNVRREQIYQLFQGFLEHPVFGSGAGAVLSNGYTRAADNASIFEATYSAILFRGGVIFSLLYFASFASIALALAHGRRQGAGFNETLRKSLLIAFIACFIANATNPYFGSSFDFSWMVYLPYICVGYLEKSAD